MNEERIARGGTMTVGEHIRFMQRRQRKSSRVVCWLFGHRYAYGTATVPPMHIWDCRWCPRSVISDTPPDTEDA